MGEEIDLKALEKKVYRRFIEDGIWDLFLGMVISNLGVISLFSLLFNLPDPLIYLIPSLGWNTIAILIFILGKKFITLPRIGFVKFGPKRKAKQNKLKIFLLLVFIVNIIFFILPFTGINIYIHIE